MIEKIPLKGIKIGHKTIKDKGSGVTALIFEDTFKAGCGWKGFSTSTRQFDSLNSLHSVEGINGLCLTGGSAFGLTAGGGVQKLLLKKKKGLSVRNKTIVPIVPTAAIFDLLYKDIYYPTENDGYDAAENASDTFEVGNVGAGTGATVGKLLSLKQTDKGGLGFSYNIINGITIMVLTVVNNFGNILDQNGNTIAGVRDNNGEFITDFMKHFKNYSPNPSENTNLSVVLTDAELTREELIKLSKSSVTAFSKHFYPALSSADGDVIVAISTGDKKSVLDIIINGTIETIGESIVQAIKYSKE